MQTQDNVDKSNQWINQDPPIVEDREAERRALSSHPTWVKAIQYLDKLEELNRSANTSSTKGLRNAIQVMQDTTDELISTEKENPFWPEKINIRPVGRIVSLLRFIRFGGRISEGPEVSDIPERYIQPLTEGHKQAYNELITKGHAPTKLSSGRGYAGEHRPEYGRAIGTHQFC